MMMPSLRISKCLQNGLSNFACSLYRNQIQQPILCANLPLMQFGCEKKTVAEELGLPNPPRKPLSAKLEYQRQLLSKNPSTSRTELASMTNNRWPSVGEEYDSQFKKEYEQYKAKYTEYLAKLTPEQVADMKALKIRRSKEKQLRIERLKKQREFELLGRPKYPGNGYTIFVVEQFKHLQENESDETLIMTKAAKLWKSLSDDKKRTYLEQSKANGLKYEEDLLAWEKRMMKQGREDLVRNKTMKILKKKEKKAGQ